VWTQDVDRGWEVARQLEAGVSWVNMHSPLGLIRTEPYGGRKGSGIGRSMGQQGLLSYTSTHVVAAFDLPGAKSG
jgi:acyl-CoA reductase-like NAD-dependent aldehyde dehydrogenase